MHADSFLYTGQQARDIDAIAINGLNIPGIQLMKNAGRAAFALLLRHYSDARVIGIVCGNGNNAGDGYIVAGLALQQGLKVYLVQVGNAQALKGDAALARDWALAAGLDIHTFCDADSLAEMQSCGIIVDALLGTGIRGPVRPDFQTCIDVLNAMQVPILSIDLPSGLNPDTGSTHGSVIRADHSISFIVRKRGLYTAQGTSCAGQVHFDQLGLPSDALANQIRDADIQGALKGVAALYWENLANGVPKRDARANTSKNAYGHVLVIGGDEGMGGAVCLAGQAALRCGGGLVSVVTRDAHVGGILARQPELMVLGTQQAEHSDRLSVLIERSSVIVIGPGLGTGAWGQALLESVLAHNKPMVLDADALNILSLEPELAKRLRAVSTKLCTPHPGEAARLLKSSPANVQLDRFAAVAALSKLFACDVILKGAGSLVSSFCEDGGEDIGVCMHGNAGMATAGMGDILSGVAGAFIGMGMPVSTAARAAMCVHSAAADLAVERQGMAGLVAGDVLPCLRELMNA
jgi:hydroxyethylthiazole kinase-like uncharacterized protein yjeF